MHVLESEPMITLANLKPSAIVPDSDSNLLLTESNFQADRFGSSMLLRVIHALLNNVDKLFRHVRPQDHGRV